MNWVRIAQQVNIALTILLVLRLLLLRLHAVYRVFCIFLAYDLFASLISYNETGAHASYTAYTMSWIALRVGAWILSLWMVYALISAVLQTLPGILRFSKNLLNYVFPIAVAIGSLTFRPEYVVATSGRSLNGINRALAIALVLDRVISTIALIVLVAILAFVLWFPVKMPRNLAIFSIGYIVYFATETGVVLLTTMSQFKFANLANASVNFILSGCLLYWTLFITRRGEEAPVRVGHSWQASERARLIEQLETINATLLRASSGPTRAGTGF